MRMPTRHTAGLYIEDMQLISADMHEQTRSMMRELQKLSTRLSVDTHPVVEGEETPMKQKKCRKLSRYPTVPDA